MNQPDPTLSVAAVADPHQTTPFQPLHDAARVGPNAVVGDYEILDEIAQGGMGVVYKARHAKLNRIVALKMTRSGDLASDKENLRFKAEAEAAAKLDHPHIVPIYEVGEHGGRHFFSMAFIEGRSLAEEVVASPLPPRRAAALMKQVADAVAYAHLNGVIHRDLKPGNIMLDAAGQPRVTDFGLAKRTDADSSLTQAGQVMGTPSYMPPEQAEGKVDQVGPLADVYSLGATLYCLLTGRPPFQSANVLETLKQVVEREPVAPRALNPAVDRDLDTIVLKCLQKSLDKRYGSATALSDDLQRWLDRRPIRARPVGDLEKLARWCRRNPVAAASLAGIVGVFLMAFALVSWSYVRAEEARRVAEQRGREERWERYRSNLIAAGSAMQLHNVSAARGALDAAPEEHRHWEWRHYHHQLDAAHFSLSVGGPIAEPRFSMSGGLVALNEPGGTIRVWDLVGRREVARLRDSLGNGTACFNRDDTLFAYVRLDNTIEIRDLAANRSRAILRGHEKPVNEPSFSPDSTLLAAGCTDRTVRLWEVATGRQLPILRGHEGGVGSVSFSPDGRRLVTAGDQDRTARIWNLGTGKTIAVLAGHAERVTNARFNGRVNRVLTAEFFPCNDLRLWDAATGKLIEILRGHTNEARHLEFSADGSWIATGSFDQTVRLWDGRTGAPLATLAGHAGWISAIAFSPDGKRLASASQDQTVRLWDAATGASLGILHGHTADVVGVAWLPDGATVVSTSIDGDIRWWDARLAERQGVLRGHASFAYGVAFHPDGERVASASWDGSVRIWNATTGEELRRLNYPEKTIVTSVSFHPSGKLLASLGRDDAVRVWDVDTGAEVRRLPVPSKHWMDSRVAFSPRGDLLACGSKDRTVHVWEVNTWTETAVLHGHQDFIRDVVFAVDGTWLASAAEDGDKTVRIWDLATKKQVQVLEGHSSSVYALAVSPDGKWLASGSMDGMVRLWDTATWKEAAALKHGVNVYGLSFDPDGRRLACACANNTIRLWDIGTRKSVAELHGHAAYVHQAAFSPDGTRLVSGSGDSTVRVWDALSAQERAETSRKAPRRP